LDLPFAGGAEDAAARDAGASLLLIAVVDCWASSLLAASAASAYGLVAPQPPPAHTASPPAQPASPKRRQSPQRVRHLLGFHARGHSSKRRERGLHSAIIDAGTASTASFDLRGPTTQAVAAPVWFTPRGYKVHVATQCSPSAGRQPWSHPSPLHGQCAGGCMGVQEC
jgi:hypothetical protein